MRTLIKTHFSKYSLKELSLKHCFIQNQMFDTKWKSTEQHAECNKEEQLVR